MIRVHDTYQYDTLFTQNDVELFSDLTGDKNPIHLNKSFAAQSEYGRQIVQGMLIASVFSKVFGTMWPGEDSIYISQETIFVKPVFVEEPYTVKFECIAVDGERAIGTLQGYLKDKDGDVLVKVTARIKSKSQFSLQTNSL